MFGLPGPVLLCKKETVPPIGRQCAFYLRKITFYYNFLTKSQKQPCHIICLLFCLIIYVLHKKAANLAKRQPPCPAPACHSCERKKQYRFVRFCEVLREKHHSLAVCGSFSAAKNQGYGWKQGTISCKKEKTGTEKTREKGKSVGEYPHYLWKIDKNTLQKNLWQFMNKILP